MAITHHLHCDRSFGNRTFRLKTNISNATQGRRSRRPGHKVHHNYPGRIYLEEEEHCCSYARSLDAIAFHLGDAESTTPSQTQQQDTQRETQQNTSKQDVEVTQELVEKYSQYVSQEGDQFRLNAPENLKSDNAQEVSKVQEIINNTNEDIASGQTEVTDNESDDQTVETAAGKHKASGSHGGYEYKWWGIQFWLDEWATQEYTNSLSQGVSADKIAADFCAWTGIKSKTVVKVSQTLRIDAKIVRTSNWQNRGIIVNAPVGKFTRAWCQPRHADKDTPDVQKPHKPHKPQKPE